MNHQGYMEAKEKSQFVFQYNCCGNKWWGAAGNNTCRRCKRVVDRLPLAQMSGIGWFSCSCGRKFAGICRGDVKSKCHDCGEQNLPEFIVSGDNAAKSGDSDKKHHCQVCKGSTPCPIVSGLRRY